MKRLCFGALLVVALAACSNSGSSTSPPINPGGTVTNQTTFRSLTAIPGLAPGGKFTYDIGAVDPIAHRYFVTNRTLNEVDELNSDTGAFITAFDKGGFAGQQLSNDNSGPDGIVVLPGKDTIFVGDVNSVKVIKPSTGTLVATIPVTTSGFRTDEGCYDPDDNLVLMNNTADSPPFSPVFSPATNTVVTTVQYPAGTAGLEACIYDPATKNFLVNNDGTPANPTGELDVIPASSVVAGAPVVAASYPEPNCNPVGMALGQNETLMVGCSGVVGLPVQTLFFNAATGQLIKTLNTIGGPDEVDYNPKTNRFYLACRYMTANGIVAPESGPITGPFSPVLGVVDGSSLTLLQSIPTGSGSHSVAVDPNTGNVFVPVAPTTTAPGGIAIYN